MTLASSASIPNARMLTKSLFLAGLQCQKRLYLRDRDDTPTAAIGLADQYLLNQGNEITGLAHTRFLGGILVAPLLGSQSAVDLTSNLIEDAATTSIFEAAFIADDILIRVDILERIGPNEWRMIEVKSTTKLKDEHVPDIAIQAHVMRRAGIRVGSICLMHLNREYVYEGGQHDLNSLFATIEVGKEVEEFLKTIEARLEEQRVTLALPVVPHVAPGKHCTVPRECEFFGRCNPELPEDHISHLPRLSSKKKALLDALGVTSVHDVPDDFDLTDLQRRIVECVKAGRPYVSPELSSALARLTWPLLYMDFETWSPAIPLLLGTRTYDQIPFQWSIHIEDVPDGELRHLEFLAEGEGDPRSFFLDSLLRAVESAPGSIVVYSAFEATQLKALSASVAGSAARIEKIYPRLWDLLATVKDYVYYPAFCGSFSIKNVLPAMRSELHYDHLSIRDGATASAAYDRTRKTTIACERTTLREGLLAYCRQDTLSMYELLRVLRGSAQPLRAGSG